MDQLDDKLRNIVLAGIGAVVQTVEKSRDAIADFAKSAEAKSLADKGEKAVQSAVDAGAQALKKVKDAITEAELNDRVRKEKDRLKNLARQVHELSAEQTEVFDELLRRLREKPPEMSFGPIEGKDPPSEEALGPPGVSGAAQVPQNDGKKPYSPTSPDDEYNVRRIQTNVMNEHLKQNVPPDF
ncbi:MAG: hypothetical protein GXY84_03405 [Clostridiales bacterium]|nr:hypothetical protein [Clostridiales bacterium]